MSSFKVFLSWYTNIDVVPTLEAKQKMVVFQQNKDIVTWKLGCTLPYLANICVHKSTDAKIYPFAEGDKDLLEKNREDVVGGLSNVFTRKAVVDETFIRKSANLCKRNVGIDACQLYPYSMCPPMTTGLYARWNFHSGTSRFTPRQNKKTRSLKNMVMSYSQRTRPEWKLKASLQQSDRIKLIASVLMGFVL